MLIKDLITQLEVLYNTYDEDYKEVIGEPEIAIDLFQRKYSDSPNYDRIYAGISDVIYIEENPHNWPSPVISSFAEESLYEDYRKKMQAPQSPDPAWPKEESWET